MKNPPVPTASKEAAKTTDGKAAHSRLASLPRTPVDHFILEKLTQKGLRLSPPADKRTLIRRASFDLTGLLPTPQEVEAFCRGQVAGSLCRCRGQIAGLPPHYGERWGRHWLDVARFADTKGYVYGGREETKFIHSAAYRD